MIEYRAKIGKILVGVWLNGNKGNIVLGCGLPQYLDKYHPFVIQMQRLGYNLFVPRYQGTFESEGEFTTQNSKETLENTIKFVKIGKTKELFSNSEIKWDNKKPLFLFGYSYGALPALLVGEKVEKIILICPFVNIKYHLDDSEGENIIETLKFLERAYSNLYRFKVDNIIKDILRVKLPDKRENLILITGKDDNLIPKQEIIELSQKYPKTQTITKDGGHSIRMDDEFIKPILTRK